MDSPTNKSPRKELQGPRPAPLRVSKESHKIRKPPVAPPPPDHQHRQPVIIYTVSPKVIHVNPNDFRNLVQRLTGLHTSSSSSSSVFNDNTGAVSPAARLATIEKTKSPDKLKKSQNDEVGIAEGFDLLERSGFVPGILSPAPNSLPQIPPSFFSPQSDPNSSLSFLHDFSPVLQNNSRNFMEGNFMPSPSSFLSPHVISPSLTFDLFNNLFDFS